VVDYHQKYIPLTSEFPRVVFIEVAKELLDLIGFEKPTMQWVLEGTTKYSQVLLNSQVEADGT